jgi:hypothetical protein
MIEPVAETDPDQRRLCPAAALGDRYAGVEQPVGLAR